MFILVLYLSYASAFNFFDIFEEMGGEPQGGHRRPGDSEEKGQSSPVDTDPRHSCSGYVCPGTSICVERPFDCPCPYGTLKYPIGDWYACIQYGQLGEKFGFPVKAAI
jgi:hypothetical protein